ADVVKLQQKVTVTVTEVDINRKRIALSMKEHQKKEGAPRDRQASGKPAQGKSSSPAANNPFQSKLTELKKKFND
ncbi:MAG TPA: hypothetical protein PLX49_13420, partial [Prolixibacteraceae bacterium]|nr:hypothetical protein [Prolixibacteraceae bacterium]